MNIGKPVGKIGEERLKEDPKFYYEHKWEKLNYCPKCKGNKIRYTGQINEIMIMMCLDCKEEFYVDINTCEVQTLS